MDYNEKITLTDYDINWINKFAYEAKIIQSHFPDVFIEHIGSTSVEGMVSKPIIDILVGINPYPPSIVMMKTLLDLGYIDLSEPAGLKFRKYLAKREKDNYNLHIVEYLDDNWYRFINFRDRLRSNSDDREKYSELKKNIIKKGITTFVEYCNEKDTGISNIFPKK